LLQTPIWFFKDLGEHYLIGYRSKGISLYNKKNKTYQHFSQADGLVSDNTMDAFVTKEGKAWIATRNGLSFFDPVTKIFKNYGYDEGILNNDFFVHYTITGWPYSRRYYQWIGSIRSPKCRS
jgi:hypothetical protein